MNEDRAFKVFLSLFGLFFLWLFTVIAFVLRVEAHCMSLGWADGTVAFPYSGYCTARVEQTDVVVPWRDAYRRSQ